MSQKANRVISSLINQIFSSCLSSLDYLEPLCRHLLGWQKISMLLLLHLEEPRNTGLIFSTLIYYFSNVPRKIQSGREAS